MVTKEYRKQIKEIFGEYRNLLNLPKSWRISIRIDNEIKEYANVALDYEKRKFDIHLNPALNKDINDLRDTILHELIHVFFSPATSRIDDLIKDIQDKKPIDSEMAKSKVIEYEEYLVEKLTKILIKQEKRIVHEK